MNDNLDNIKNLIIAKALKIRAFENTLLSLFSEGKLNGTVHTCIGEELIGATIGSLVNEEDYIVSNHRGHGHYIGRFDNYEPLLAEILGKETGCSGGFGGSQHICGKNFLTNGIQGGMTPIALGIALSNIIKVNKNISVAFIGDGTLGQGVLYETMNFATVLEVPLLLILENNGYAQSTPQKMFFNGSIEARVLGFGFDYYNTDSNNVDDLIATAGLAIENARKRRPTFLEIKTYRLNAHSKGDDNRYLDEIEKAKKIDYLTVLIEQNKLYFDIYHAYLSEIYATSEIVVGNKTLLSIPIRNERNTNGIIFKLPSDCELRYNQQINSALHDLMNEYSNIFLVGEDIIDKSKFTEFNYGGAFKVTSGLSTSFESRVINTPISEQCIIGLATGMGVRGFIIIAEIMFGDFTTLIIDQVLQHLTKFETIYNSYVKPSVIIRTPMGGKRGYGPTHSQSLEKLFLGIPNLRVIALNKYLNPYEIYKKLILDNVPSFVVENKILYTERTDYILKDIYDYDIIVSGNFPIIWINPKKNSINSFMTILVYGQTLTEIEKVAEYFYFEEEIIFDIFCFVRLDAISCDQVLKSVGNTGRVMIIEEGNGFASWGSEILAYISTHLKNSFKTYRLSNNNIIPSSLSAELEIIPNKEMIIKKIKEII